MPTIQRLSREQYERGEFTARPGFVAIRIADPAAGFADVAHEGLHSEYRFEFSDVESESEPTGEAAITQNQAFHIAGLLRRAMEQERDVVVHCNRGVRRSGAVCLAGFGLGFRYEQLSGDVNMRALNFIQFHI